MSLNLAYIFLLILMLTGCNRNSEDASTDSVQKKEQISPEVQRLLEQIPKVNKDDTIRDFLARSNIEINKDANIIGGMTSLGEDGYVWQVGNSGNWIMSTTSKREYDQQENELIGELEDGNIVGIRIYYRDEVTEEIDYDNMKKMLPFIYGYELHTQHNKTK